ncbi:MAG TPA: tyrosine-type recombinase/integrase [Acetobacteraceae bacterium]|jgi:integrase|nr:tyrosine-type recombinase/integrase [Acetobacteraceae bacterium]
MFAAARKSKAPAALLTIITDGLRAPRQPDRVRPKQILADAEIRKLVEAAFIQNADFGALVMVLAATGARMDQVARLTVADFQPAARRLMVPSSRKGRGDRQVTHIAVPLSDDVVVRLRRIIAGRLGHEPLLLRWHHQQVAGDSNTGAPPRWERVSRKPWSNTAQMTRPWRVMIENAKLPTDLVPYCLRHSSIARGLRAGLPAQLVSAVHDTSVAMIKKDYAVFIVDAPDDLLRHAVMPLLSGEVDV